MALLCSAPHCRTRGRHLPDCDTPDCTGCEPRVAADGLRLCHVCTRRLAEDASTAAHLYRELELALSAAERAGERTSGSPDRARVPNPRAVEARSEIRHVLVGWAKLIAEERGWTLPADDITAIAAYVANSAEWLAATDYADDAAGELHDLAHGPAYGVAYPSGTRVFEVCPCSDIHQGCEGRIRAVLRRTDSLLPSTLLCSENPDHQFPAYEWLTLGRSLTKAKEAA